MEELYNKIINKEVDIKYLSPKDLLNLIDYLDQDKIKLNNVINLLRSHNKNLEDIKNNLRKEIDNAPLN